MPGEPNSLADGRLILDTICYSWLQLEVAMRIGKAANKWLENQQT